MVKIKIDNKSILAAEGKTIMEVAKDNGIHIPKLCYLKDINEIAACRVCVVELEGKEKLVTSCNNKVEEGMVIYTNSPKVRKHRSMTVKMLLAQHDCQCVTCVRSGNCNLQKIANSLNILDLPYVKDVEKRSWDMDFPLIRDAGKCIKCMRCIQVCDKVQSLGVWDVEGTGSRTTVNVAKRNNIRQAPCSLCGQCIVHCPVGALRERDDTANLWDAIDDPNKIVVAQVAPAVRTSWGEAFGMSQEEATIGKLLDALKSLGIDYVFDTTFSADLTIMEEGSEFVAQYKAGKLRQRPLFTSCCPGWVRFVKSEFPHMIQNLSTAKSPQQMFGATMKSYFADTLGVDPSRIYTVSIMPCLAKKAEREMNLYHEEFVGHDVDMVLTTRELVRILKSVQLNPKTLKDIQPDSPMQAGSGAGVIFGTTGGVMEAALRSAYYLIKGENPDPNAFWQVRNPDLNLGEGLQEGSFMIDDIPIRVAVVSGLGNARKLLKSIERGEAQYDFVEVMACPGGCAYGGGQPIHDGGGMHLKRGARLYSLDENMKLRFSHENPDIIHLYKEYFEEPLSHKAHRLLHTDHTTY